MNTYLTAGILLLVIGLIALAFERVMPQTRPVSTLVMWIGVGVGLLLLAVGIFVLVTHGDTVYVNSMGVL